MTRSSHTRFRVLSRIGPSVGVACLLAASTVGCKTSQSPSSVLGSKVGLGSSTAAKTDFSREATPEQGFNLHMELARVRSSESNHEAAVSEILLALEIADKRGSLLMGGKLGPEKQALAHRRAAESFDMLGRFAQADVHYSKALKIAPGDPKIWNSAGYSYYLQNRLTDAERALKIAASHDPSDPKIQTNLGLTLAAAGKTDDALSALTKAGGPAVGQANLGFILAAMGEKAEARKHYETAIALQPELAPARMALAQLDIGTKDAAVSIASATTDIPLPALPRNFNQGTVSNPSPVSIPVPVPIATGVSKPIPMPVTLTHAPRIVATEIPTPVPAHAPVLVPDPIPAKKVPLRLKKPKDLPATLPNSRTDTQTSASPASPQPSTPKSSTTANTIPRTPW